MIGRSWLTLVHGSGFAGLTGSSSLGGFGGVVGGCSDGSGPRSDYRVVAIRSRRRRRRLGLASWHRGRLHGVRKPIPELVDDRRRATWRAFALRRAAGGCGDGRWTSRASFSFAGGRAPRAFALRRVVGGDGGRWTSRAGPSCADRQSVVARDFSAWRFLRSYSEVRYRASGRLAPHHRPAKTGNPDGDVNRRGRDVIRRNRFDGVSLRRPWANFPLDWHGPRWRRIHGPQQHDKQHGHKHYGSSRRRLRSRNENSILILSILWINDGTLSRTKGKEKKLYKKRWNVKRTTQINNDAIIDSTKENKMNFNPNDLVKYLHGRDNDENKRYRVVHSQLMFYKILFF